MPPFPVAISPEIMSGAPVFAGTRVPLKALFDHLEGGETIDDFLDGFPTVTRDQVLECLRFSQQALVSSAVKS